jgi:hypothetical protein
MSCIPCPLIFKYVSAGIVLECYKIFHTSFGWRLTSMVGLSYDDQNTCIVLLHPIYPVTTPNIPNIYRLASATTMVICPSLDRYISKRSTKIEDTVSIYQLYPPPLSLSFHLYSSLFSHFSVFSVSFHLHMTFYFSFYNPWPVNLISGNT